MICSEWIRLIETIIDMLIQHCSGWSSLSRNWNHILIMRIVKNNTECYFITARPHCLYHNVISLFSANQHPPSAVNVTRYSHLLLSAGLYSPTPAAGDRYLLLVGRSAANPPIAVICCRSMGEKDGRTDPQPRSAYYNRAIWSSVHLHCRRECDKALQPVFLCFVQEILSVVTTHNDKRHLREV